MKRIRFGSAYSPGTPVRMNFIYRLQNTGRPVSTCAFSSDYCSCAVLIVLFSFIYLEEDRRNSRRMKSSTNRSGNLPIKNENGDIDAEVTNATVNPEISSPSPRKRDHSPVKYDLKEDEESNDAEVSKPCIAPEVHPPAGEKRKKTKTYDYVTKLNYLFRDARFFVMKSGNEDNVALAKAKGVWSTPPQNEAKLNHAFEECRNVLLLFSVKESGKFAGEFTFIENLA